MTDTTGVDALPAPQPKTPRASVPWATVANNVTHYAAAFGLLYMAKQLQVDQTTMTLLVAGVAGLLGIKVATK